MTIAGGITGEAELLDHDEVGPVDPVLGLEVHVELSTATKMFCACSTTFGAEPTPRRARCAWARVRCPPSTRPRSNPPSASVGAELRHRALVPLRPEEPLLSDMPKNYQISAVRRTDRRQRHGCAARRRHHTWRVGIERRIWRRTPASSPTSAGGPAASMGRPPLLDFNRAGVPLIEIVTNRSRAPVSGRPR